jgi:metal-responsive CopG/Arc/MetJ family transcriptional regulator
MTRTKIAITLDTDTLIRLDHLIKEQGFPSRSKVIREAISTKIEQLERSRLATECAKLDQVFEKALAEEGLSGELAGWPEY